MATKKSSRRVNRSNDNREPTIPAYLAVAVDDYAATMGNASYRDMQETILANQYEWITDFSHKYQNTTELNADIRLVEDALNEAINLLHAAGEKSNLELDAAMMRSERAIDRLMTKAEKHMLAMDIPDGQVIIDDPVEAISSRSSNESPSSTRDPSPATSQESSPLHSPRASKHGSISSRFFRKNEAEDKGISNDNLVANNEPENQANNPLTKRVKK